MPRLDEARLAPLRDLLARARALRPRPDLLAGVHNPFGTSPFVAYAWECLDVAESAVVLDTVAARLGDDLVLWDSALLPDLAALEPDEGLRWPVVPLAGALAVVTLPRGEVRTAALDGIAALVEHGVAGYVLRYFPATSRFVRDTAFPANRRAANAHPLVNTALRPLWLVRGSDRAGNDFATGFSTPAARWTGAPQTG